MMVQKGVIMPESARATPQIQSNVGLAAIYGRFAGFLNNWQSLFLLLIRIYIGYQCIISGWAHLHHLDATTKFFTTLHIPFPKLNVIISATTELFGGALLLVGVASRLVSLVLTGNFLVALLTAELSSYHFSWKELGAQIWADQSPILSDTAFPFLATTIIILLFGPGLFSIDGIIKAVRGKK
jgi:putative oxidoreductase